MLARYIHAIILACCLIPVQAGAGDLEGLTNAFENLADMSRSADDANEALRNVIRGEPSRYYRDYDRRYYYDDYHPDRHYHRHDWKEEKERAKAIRKAEKKWRKHHEHEWRKHHRPYHGKFRHPGPPPLL